MVSDYNELDSFIYYSLSLGAVRSHDRHFLKTYLGKLEERRMTRNSTGGTTGSRGPSPSTLSVATGDGTAASDRPGINGRKRKDSTFTRHKFPIDAGTNHFKHLSYSKARAKVEWTHPRKLARNIASAACHSLATVAVCQSLASVAVCHCLASAYADDL